MSGISTGQSRPLPPEIRRMQRDDQAMRKWSAEVSTAALAFERRWTMAALKRVDADLHRRLFEQRALFDRVMFDGDADEIDTQGSAMCRGYAAAVKALDRAGEPDDAYMIGRCPRTGFTVAIGGQKAAADRVREVHGDRVVWVTPDEVASMLNAIEAFKPISTIKRMFPGAEIIDRYADEPAQDARVRGTDIESGTDFLVETMHVGAIITNPPYVLAEQFIQHALRPTQEWDGLVAMLLRTDYDHAKTRQHLFGFCPKFAKKVVLTKRIQWFEDSKGSPSFNHAGFIWDWKHEGAPTLAYGP